MATEVSSNDILKELRNAERGMLIDPPNAVTHNNAVMALGHAREEIASLQAKLQEHISGGPRNYIHKQMHAQLMEEKDAEIARLRSGHETTVKCGCGVTLERRLFCPACREATPFDFASGQKATACICPGGSPDGALGWHNDCPLHGFEGRNKALSENGSDDVHGR